MARGKFSPTIIHLLCNTDYLHEGAIVDGRESIFDVEGYDCYGYNVFGVDRAGHCEADYYTDSEGTLMARIKNDWKHYSGPGSTPKHVSNKVEEVVVTLFTDKGTVKTAYPIEMCNAAVALFKDYVSNGKKASISTF